MSALLHRNLKSAPAIARDGRGIRLTDTSGHTVIDGSGGAAVASIGHSHPRVLAALRDQLDRLAYAHTGLYSNEPAEALAEILVGHKPAGLARAYFVSSGSEATEAALKLARQYMLEIGEPQRDRFIARRQSYHGNTLGALGVSGNMIRRPPYEAILPQTVALVSPCYPYRGKTDGEDDAAYVARLLAEYEETFQRVGPGRVAAVFAEPVVGATLGCVAAPPGYFTGLREICDRHGALLVLDEVMCGMGRTGTLHAFEQEGIAPDIEIVAKGLGGGYQPIGGLLIAERVVAAMEAGSGIHRHGHTYSAHPIACAAALAVQRVMAEDDLVANCAARGHDLAAALRARLGDHPNVGEIRGRGLFYAVEMVADRATKAPFDPELGLADRIKYAAFRRGLACYPMNGTIDGHAGDHVILAPPYIVTAADIDEIVDRLALGIGDALAECARQAA
ncbi:aspartate aminotransferase family protein [Acuticoccus sp. I52.16.1]|uniref:aspartate aminotransferase family protein n=1 Tax=Acuticoccus sp. I52.16.1 TaxID=2928472 RepID=UPI001FD0697C|nr:aspartate aminotransferase family protein [Acuticoccus sp. I52.16.1]UOM33095.1 aspartate aminotransferase family protein [Acuticoccus sp. I52.16.1]